MKLSTVRFAAIAFVMVSLAGNAVRAAENAPIVAVFDVSNQGARLAPDVMKRLGDFLAGRLATCGRFRVVPRDQVKLRLVDQKKESHKECYDQTCQIELGKSLAADKSLSTSLIKLGNTCEISSSLYDLRTETTELAATAESLCNENGVRDGLKSVINQLCGRASDNDSDNRGMTGGKESVGGGGAATPVPQVDEGGPTVKGSAVTASVGDLTVQGKTATGKAVRLELTDPAGKAVVSGSPYKDSKAKIGTWKVVAKASGHESEERQFTVSPDDSTLIKIELKQLGGLRVAGEPAGSAVKISGPGGFSNESGMPWEAEGLKSGTYRVVISREGYSTETRDVAVEPGKTAVATVKLEKTVSKAVSSDTSLKQAQTGANDSVAVPGVGIGGIVIGKSTPEDVLNRYGRDCRIGKYDDGKVFVIDYEFVNQDRKDSTRSSNKGRPEKVGFVNGAVSYLDFGTYQKDISLRGGVTVDSNAADVTRAFGKPDRLLKDDDPKGLDEWQYKQGIRFFVDKEDNGVNSFRIAGRWGTDDVLAVPGVGIGGIVIGKSTVEDVLRRYGTDCKVHRHRDGRVYSVNYSYVNSSEFRSADVPDTHRPKEFEIEGGLVTKIEISSSQKFISTNGGIWTGSNSDDVRRVFGKPDRLERDPKPDGLDEWFYRSGIVIFVDKESNEINSIEIVPRW